MSCAHAVNLPGRDPVVRTQPQLIPEMFGGGESLGKARPGSPMNTSTVGVWKPGIRARSTPSTRKHSRHAATKSGPKTCHGIARPYEPERRFPQTFQVL